MIIVITQCH